MTLQSSTLRNLKIFLHVAFFISGITTVLIGQVLPILSARFQLNDLQTSLFFPAQFSGSLLGTFLTNGFGKRNKFLPASYIGCFLMVAGILLLNLGSFSSALIGLFLNGIGVGLTLPAINMLILELNPLRAASALNILNFFWGLGAIICSLTVLSLSKSIGFLPVSIAISLPLALVAVYLLFVPQGFEQSPQHEETTDSEAMPPIWTNPLAWLIALFNFIHVGFESAIGGWLPTYTERFGDGYQWWLAPTFLYFLLFVVGRGVAPVFLRFLNENQMLLSGLLTVTAGMLILLFAPNVMIVALGAAVAGFGTSSIFPTNMSRFTQTFGPTASRRMTPFFIFGTLGAAATTAIVGYTSNQTSNLRYGMFVLLGSAILLLFLQFYLRATAPQRASAL